MLSVSIIIPIYNVEQYVERCLKSVIAQTYTNLECILVDDCTPDNSIPLCEKLIANYTGPIRFRILHHDRNRGLSAARNTGTDAASGDYLYYLDSDDELTTECISILVNEINLHPNVELVQGNVKSVPYAKYYDIDLYHNPCFIENAELIQHLFFRPHNAFPVNAWNKLISKAFIATNNISFLENLIHEDQLWIFLVGEKIQSLSIVGDVTYIHYSTQNSIMTSTSQKRSCKNWGEILAHISRHTLILTNPSCLYKYIWRFYHHFPLAWSTKSYWFALPKLSRALWKLGNRNLTIRLLLYSVTIPFHQGKWKSLISSSKLLHLWEVNSPQPE